MLSSLKLHWATECRDYSISPLRLSSGRPPSLQSIRTGSSVVCQTNCDCPKVHVAWKSNPPSPFQQNRFDLGLTTQMQISATSTLIRIGDWTGGKPLLAPKCRWPVRLQRCPQPSQQVGYDFWICNLIFPRLLTNFGHDA